MRDKAWFLAASTQSKTGEKKAAIVNDEMEADAARSPRPAQVGSLVCRVRVGQQHYY